jgi:hypothetical protein
VTRYPDPETMSSSQHNLRAASVLGRRAGLPAFAFGRRGLVALWRAFPGVVPGVEPVFGFACMAPLAPLAGTAPCCRSFDRLRRLVGIGSLLLVGSHRTCLRRRSHRSDRVQQSRQEQPRRGQHAPIRATMGVSSVDG